MVCKCGQNLGLEQEDVFERLNEICKQYELRLEEEKVSQIRKMADAIVSLILNVEYPKIDVDKKMDELKELISEISPDQVHLYELIYEPRFARLWKKFRETTSD